MIAESRRGIHLLGTARVVENDREFAWAEKHVHHSPGNRWILGNFVEANNPNQNGHIFPFEDLQTSIDHIPHKPLNLLHIPGRRVGTFAAAEFVYPNESAADGSGNPIIEALAAFWEYYERDLWPSIQMAHREGTLFFSMEAVPESLTCKGKGDYEGCGGTFEYAGRQSPTYCDHLNLVASRKVLHKPVFTGGALITPGTKPGWRNARVKELSKLIEDDLEQADLLFREIADEAPHMSTLQIENVMAWFLAQGEESYEHAA